MTSLGETQAFVGTVRQLEAALGRAPYAMGATHEESGFIWYAFADGRLGCESIGFGSVESALEYARKQTQLARIVDCREAWRAPMLTNKARAYGAPARELWRVTFEIVTPESAEEGEAESQGFISEGESSLRYALELAAGSYSAPPAESASDSNLRAARWLTFHYGENIRTGARESRSLHIPSHITPASRARLARYCGL